MFLAPWAHVPAPAGMSWTFSSTARLPSGMSSVQTPRQVLGLCGVCGCGQTGRRTSPRVWRSRAGARWSRSPAGPSSGLHSPIHSGADPGLLPAAGDKPRKNKDTEASFFNN